MPPAKKSKAKKDTPAQRMAKAVVKRDVPHPLSRPITSFRIPVNNAALPDEDWGAYHVRYGMPVIKLHRYRGDEEPHEACQVPVYIGSQPTVYLPLPMRYRDAWVLLSYRIVYWANIRDFWKAETQKNLPPKKKEIARFMMPNCAVRLLTHILARRLAAEQLLTLEWQQQEFGKELVSVLDEYLIRDRRDLLFTKFGDVPKRDVKFLKSDPCNPLNDKLFSA